MDAPRVVFISRQRIVGPTNGSSTYLIDLARAVRAAGLVPHLVQPSPIVFGRMPILRFQPAMDVFASVRMRSATRFGGLRLALKPALYVAAAIGVLSRFARSAGVTASWARDRKLPHSISTPWIEADRAFVRAHVEPGDIVILDYVFQVEALRALPAPPRASAIVMHDLFHARAAFANASGIADSSSALSRAQEIALMARADAVIAIQDEEAAFVREAVPGTRAILAPMSYETRPAAQPGENDRLLFVGSNTPPNVIGLQWLLDHAWPRIRAARPDATLDVAGTVARAFTVAPPEGVRFLGLVDDLRPLYTRAGVVISPLTFGSGLKVKLIEALAQGKAIVATPVTMQGVEAIAGDAVRVAEDPAAFADAVIALSTDPAERTALAARALAVAEAHFSPAASHGAFVAWLREQL